VPIVLKFGSLNLLKTSGPVQACSGIAFPFLLPVSMLSRASFHFSSFSVRLLSTAQRRTALNMYWWRETLTDIYISNSLFKFWLYLFTTWTVASPQGSTLKSRTNTQLWRRKLSNTLLLGVRLSRCTQHAVGRRTDCPLPPHHCPPSCIFTTLWHEREPCSAKVAQHSSCTVLP